MIMILVHFVLLFLPSIWYWKQVLDFAKFYKTVVFNYINLPNSFQEKHRVSRFEKDCINIRIPGSIGSLGQLSLKYSLIKPVLCWCESSRMSWLTSKGTWISFNSIFMSKDKLKENLSRTPFPRKELKILYESRKFGYRKNYWSLHYLGILEEIWAFILHGAAWDFESSEAKLVI